MTRARRAAVLASCLACAIAIGCGRSAPVDSAHPSERTPVVSDTQTKPKGRLFSAQDLGLLDAPDRGEWQKPDQIMDALKIAEGSKVADLGAGGGWFTIQLARRVEQSGVVYAEDIQRLMLVALERRVEREGLTNVRTVLGTATDPKLPTDIDAALIVDAYHEMEDSADPAQVIALLKNVERLLKPQGCLGVVDFEPGGGGPGPEPGERVNPETVVKAAAAAGLKLVKQEAVPPFQFLLIFGKAAAASRCAS
jgi:ubiquinone/menaquinone biosynthesis C-methylase UbiE